MSATQKVVTDRQRFLAELWIDQERYLADLPSFLREVLGYTLLPDHEQLCELLTEPGHPPLILMPRGSYKSSLVTIGYALWRLAKQDTLRILIYSDTTEKAQGFLEAIKNHLLGTAPRSRFREQFGPWEVDPKAGVWNQSAIVVKARQSASVEPSIDTAGIETSKVGKHYDLILFDDIVTDKNVTTKEQMDKVADCYRKALSLLMPGGEVIMLGTRWHFGDLYGRLIAENEVYPSWRLFRRAAEVNGQYPFATIGLTKEFLDRRRAVQGTYLWSCLYQQQPTDPETAAFKAEDFRFYLPSLRFQPDWQAGLYITCCVDPAISQANDADLTAITVVGTDQEWNLYLLDAVAGRFLPDETLDIMFDLHRKWAFKVLGIETTAFQRMLAQDLRRRFWEERQKRQHFATFHIEEFTGVTQKSKEQRILGLQPYHESGRLKFPGQRLELLDGVWRDLAFQLIEFPHSAKDDLSDSLAYHLFLTQRGQVATPEKTYPETSAAWYEREVWAKQQMKELQRRPRWRRPPVPQLAFS